MFLVFVVRQSIVHHHIVHVLWLIKTPFTRDRMRMVTISSFKTSMTLKFVIILQNLIKAYHRKSGRSKYDRKLTELDGETTRIRSRVNGV